jgi:hypothetical protein
MAAAIYCRSLATWDGPGERVPVNSPSEQTLAGGYRLLLDFVSTLTLAGRVKVLT